MAEGKRFTPESPSPAMKSFAEYIRGQGYDDATDLVTTVAATFVHHRDWQRGHASELETERAQLKEQREADKEIKAKEREEKKAQKAAEKEERDAEKEQKRLQKEAEKQERDAKAAQDGESSEDASAEATGEPRKRLRLKSNADAEEATAGASAGSF